MVQVFLLTGMDAAHGHSSPVDSDYPVGGATGLLAWHRLALRPENDPYCADHPYLLVITVASTMVAVLHDPSSRSFFLTR